MIDDAVDDGVGEAPRTEEDPQPTDGRRRIFVLRDHDRSGDHVRKPGGDERRHDDVIICFLRLSLAPAVDYSGDLVSSGNNGSGMRHPKDV